MTTQSFVTLLHPMPCLQDPEIANAMADVEEVGRKLKAINSGTAHGHRQEKEKPAYSKCLEIKEYFIYIWS